MDVVEYDNFLSEQECRDITEMLPSPYTKETVVIIDDDFSNKILDIIGPKMPQYKFTKHVTVGITKRAIITHIDPKLDPRVTHRMYIYLQLPSKGGGTLFEDGPYIEPKIGKAVVFDINLRHRGEEFPPGEVKKVVAFRMYKA